MLAPGFIVYRPKLNLVLGILSQLVCFDCAMPKCHSKMRSQDYVVEMRISRNRKGNQVRVTFKRDLTNVFGG